MNALKSIVLGFIAGAIAAVTAQELISWLFVQHWTGWNETPWSTEPVSSLVVPEVVLPWIASNAITGGLWGALFGFILGWKPQGMMTIRGCHPRAVRPRSYRRTLHRAVSRSQAVAASRGQRQRARADPVHLGRLRRRRGLALWPLQSRAIAVAGASLHVALTLRSQLHASATCGLAEEGERTYLHRHVGQFRLGYESTGLIAIAERPARNVEAPVCGGIGGRSCNDQLVAGISRQPQAEAVARGKDRARLHADQWPLRLLWQSLV